VLKINIKLEIKSTVAVQQSSLGQIKSNVEKTKQKQTLAYHDWNEITAEDSFPVYLPLLNS
jgi:hypothetical protein